MEIFYLDSEDTSSVKPHHETPTSDTHKSKINKSTNKSFHRQTGTYPDSTKKFPDRSGSYIHGKNCWIFQNFNCLDTTKACTEVSFFHSNSSSNLIGSIVIITCFSAKTTKLPYMEIFWIMFKFTQHTINLFIISYGRTFDCIQKQCKVKPRKFIDTMGFMVEAI